MAGEQVEGQVPDVKTPVEGTPEPKSEPQHTEIELRAMEQGWKPKEQWDGDPAEHRSAKEFLDRGELLGKIKSQAQQLREVKEMVTHLSAHNQKVYLAGYENGLRQLKQQRAAAMKEGDFDAVVALEDKIEQHQDAIATIRATPAPAPKEDPSQSPVYQEWLKNNGWYLQDESMRHWANGISVSYAHQRRAAGQTVTEEEIYDMLTKKVRADFPHKFKRTSAPNPDGEGRQSNRGNNSGDASNDFDTLVKSFSEEDARAARNLVRTGVLTKEKYVADYKAITGGR